MIPTAKVFIRINQICHPNTKRKSEITNIIDSKTRKNFFVNIGPSVARKIEKPYIGNMINRVVDSFVLKPVQNDEAKFEIKQLVGKKFRLYGFNKPFSKSHYCTSHNTSQIFSTKS